MKRAFSLLELIIVIIVIGVVYTLTITGFTNLKEKKEKITLLNLKEYLQNIPHEESVKLLCLDKCSSCNIYVDKKKLDNNNSFDNFLDDSVVVYRYDFNLGALEMEKKIHFNPDSIEENICFSFSVDAKGVGDQVLVEYKQKVYDYSTYLGKTPVYNSINEAIDEKRVLAQKIKH